MENMPLSDENRVCVIVPVYNVKNYLRRCVDSIIGQTCQLVDIVLVDDGSTDGCGEICDEYARQDKRVVVIHQSNQGLSAARNTGLDYIFSKKALGYVCFVDSDDWISASFIEESLKGLSLGAEISCARIESVLDYADHYSSICKWNLFSVHDYWLSSSSSMSIVGRLYSIKFFENIRFPVGKLYEDQFVTHRVIFLAKVVAVTQASLYYYYQRRGSIIHSRWSFRRLDFLAGLADQVSFFSLKGLHEEAAKSRYDLDREIGNAIYMLKQEARRSGTHWQYPIIQNRNINFVRHPVAMLFVWPIVRGVGILRSDGVPTLVQKLLFHAKCERK